MEKTFIEALFVLKCPNSKVNKQIVVQSYKKFRTARRMKELHPYAVI